ncbi:MAG: nitrate oxidoreductase subunit beta, partial [Planctomycetota bacterium]|nr:nitrate oxidoreductase subunit beta [Planctomycetota bacterium]
TMACKSTWTHSKGQEHMWWTNVESKPYGGYPQHWDIKTLRLLDETNPDEQNWNSEPGAKKPYGEYKGSTVFESARLRFETTAQRVMGYLPTDDEWRFPNIYEDTPKGPKGEPNKFHPTGEADKTHKMWFFYLARLCNHCTYPGCLAACPRKAIYKRPEDGIVLIDQERCRGYRKCVEACPYKKSLYRPTTRTSEKCIACYPRVEGKDPETEGLPMETRCMAACIGQVRMQGLVNIGEDEQWVEDRQNPLYYLIKVAKVALPLYPQFGTEPNGYYIPPRWVPRPYLRQMFGPGVDDAIAKYRNPDRELLAVLQLFRRANRIIFRYEMKQGKKLYETEIDGKPFVQYDDTIIAYGKDGKEIFRTNVEEPLHVRPKKHLNSI